MHCLNRILDDTNLGVAFANYRNGMRLLINEAIISVRLRKFVFNFCLHFCSAKIVLTRKKNIRPNENKRYEWKRMTKECKKYEWGKINKHRFTILLLSIENYFNYMVFAHFHRQKITRIWCDTTAKEYRITQRSIEEIVSLLNGERFYHYYYYEKYLLWNVNRYAKNARCQNLKRSKIIIK